MKCRKFHFTAVKLSVGATRILNAIHNAVGTGMDDWSFFVSKLNALRADRRAVMLGNVMGLS